MSPLITNKRFPSGIPSFYKIVTEVMTCPNVCCRRVELVLLHGPESEPQGTAAWLEARPHLARHHHIRLTHPKVLAEPIVALLGMCAGQAS